ncbi:ABC-type dipeptide/oligopeptide/nickel transport system, ATPase component [Moorella thermoacetica Y72]|nr:ABC-type dipeptide/oligopeptide/nickel transport system, ATPase component [Moorella thermoacetica Y72]
MRLMVVYVNQALKGIPVLFVEASHLTIKRKHRAADELMGLIATYCQGQVSLATIEYTGSE